MERALAFLEVGDSDAMAADGKNFPSPFPGIAAAGERTPRFLSLVGMSLDASWKGSTH